MFYFLISGTHNMMIDLTVPRPTVSVMSFILGVVITWLWGGSYNTHSVQVDFERVNRQEEVLARWQSSTVTAVAFAPKCTDCKDCNVQKIGTIEATVIENSRYYGSGNKSIKQRLKLPNSQQDNCSSSEPSMSRWNGKRNLVLSMGSSYNRNILEPFVYSCSAYVKSAVCVILRSAKDKADTATWTWLNRVPNVFFAYEGADWNMDEIIALLPKGIETDPTKMLSESKRIIAQKAFLFRNPCAFDKIVSIDSRDVFFQSDPFDNIIKGLYLDSEIYNLRFEPYNVNWVNLIRDPNDEGNPTPTIDLIPEAAPNRIEGKHYQLRPVLCSGVMAGTGPAMEAYSDAMITLLVQSKIVRYEKGLDQGFHNVLFHRYPELIWPHQANMIRSEGGWISNNYECHANQNVPFIWEPFHLNQPAIIHQYDRCKPLAKIVASDFAHMQF